MSLNDAMSRLGRSLFRLGLLGAMVVVLGACENVPTGTAGGRMDPYRTTQSDLDSTSASLPAMYEFTDATAAALARDLSDIPEVKGSPTRVVLELGDVMNKTQTPSNNFEMMQHRLRGQLMQSKLIKDNFLFVEGRARMNREVDRVNGETSGDLLQENVGSGVTAKYDPKLTYVLQGDFMESGRGGGAVRRYYFEFKLVNLASRAIVFSNTYDLGQHQ